MTSKTSFFTQTGAESTANEDFDLRYLGASATAPLSDNNGNPLLTGALYFNTTTDTFWAWDGALWIENSTGGGVIDHGSLTGLLDDDHTQYHTDARGDARYALLAHTQTSATITDFNAATDARVSTGITAHEAVGDPHPQYTTVSENNAAYSPLGHSHAGLAPAGGTTGQVLKKDSATDYAYSWQADATGGGVTDGDKGDITVTASGATWTIDTNVVTNAKAAQMATKTYKGRTSAATGDAEDVPVATLKTDLVLVKADVGLSNVDNTSDANKPVSTATQTALNLKANLASPTFTGTVSGITAAMVGAPSGSGSSTGTNTGDQTTIVGITGTKAQFDTAVTDGNFMYAGDAPTAHNHILSNVTDVTMTVANLNILDDGVNTTLHFHDADRARANHTGTQLASTISDFSTAADARIAAASINTLSDVIITTPSATQVLKYNGTNWINDTDATGGGGGGSGTSLGIVVASSYHFCPPPSVNITL